MKYIKTYEENSLKYDVGDIVVCTDSYEVIGSELRPGQKYEVIDIDKFGGITVRNIKTNKTFGKYTPDRFKLEIEYDSDRYNL